MKNEPPSYEAWIGAAGRGPEGEIVSRSRPGALFGMSASCKSAGGCATPVSGRRVTPLANPHCLQNLQNSWLNTQYSVADSTMAAGSVSTQPMMMLRIVAHCRPEPLAAMAPAMPDDSTWVVDTGRL
jgi:hypothetical protein